MCTSIALNSHGFYFGRNLDLEYEFGQRVVVTPRNYPFCFRMAGEYRTHYAMIGMATISDGYPLYAEASNERGLCIAGLNFPDNAYYPSKAAEGKDNITPFELIPWILGCCTTVAEAKVLLSRLHMIAIPFSAQIPLSPLHWHIADKVSSITVEPMQDGLKVYDNKVGVLTNNPPFDFHQTNLNQFLSVTAQYPDNRFAKSLDLIPFGLGFGGNGLPGGNSSVSRFVRAVFNKENAICGNEEESGVTLFFHLMDSVSMVKGSVITKEGLHELTNYSCCYDAARGIYFYKTYENNRLTAICLFRENLNGHRLKEYCLRNEQDILWMN